MLTVTNQVNAGSSIFFVATPQSTAGEDDPPLTASVKIVCFTTNTVVRPDTGTSISGDTVPITVTGVENALVDPTNPKEKRRVLLTVTFGIGDDFVDYADFTVLRVDLDPSETV